MPHVIYPTFIPPGLFWDDNLGVDLW